jgi:peptidoglycan/LPS O-acetylase OafA/YrhL
MNILPSDPLINPQHEKNDVAVLNGLRGMAALYVMMHHCRMELSQPYSAFRSHPEQYNTLNKILFYLTSAFRFGHEAVILFFIISGFVIHLKQARQPVKTAWSKFNMPDYFIKRVLRIYPTLLLSFLVTWLLDFILFKINDQSLSATGLYTYQTFFENFFLISAGHIWGSNGPMWSLKHEWFFYVIYPLLFLLDTIKPIIAVIVCVLFFVSFMFGLQIPLIGEAASTLIIWWMGALFAKVYINRDNGMMPKLIWLIIPGLAFSIFYKDGAYHDLACGLLFTGILALLLSNKIKKANAFITRFSFFGYFSYSIYILHFPMLVFINGMIVKYNNGLPYHLWFVLSAWIVVLPVIYGLYLLVEKPSLSFKTKLFKS